MVVVVIISVVVLTMSVVFSSKCNRKNNSQWKLYTSVSFIDVPYSYLKISAFLTHPTMFLCSRVFSSSTSSWTFSYSFFALCWLVVLSSICFTAISWPSLVSPHQTYSNTLTLVKSNTYHQDTEIHTCHTILRGLKCKTSGHFEICYVFFLFLPYPTTSGKFEICNVFFLFLPYPTMSRTSEHFESVCALHNYLNLYSM